MGTLPRGAKSPPLGNLLGLGGVFSDTSVLPWGVYWEMKKKKTSQNQCFPAIKLNAKRMPVPCLRQDSLGKTFPLDLKGYISQDIPLLSSIQIHYLISIRGAFK